ncbi:MAG: hypothetical protein HUJ31_13745 [Pseudomonadales bacterium]|nr:hypothetical protein [Pseudomonadales bacterium]
MPQIEAPRISDTALYVWSGTGALHLGFSGRSGLVYEPEEGRFTFYGIEDGRAEMIYPFSFGPSPESMRDALRDQRHWLEATGTEWLMPVIEALADGKRGPEVDPELVYRGRYGVHPLSSSHRSDLYRADLERRWLSKAKRLLPGSGAPRTFFIVGLIGFALAVLAGHGIVAGLIGGFIVYLYYIAIIKRR